MLSSDASYLGMWATDGGRRADSSTRFPGASSLRIVLADQLTKISLISA
jgi:hypothetical protein